MTKKVLVLLAEGFEDVEATTPADYLRRAGAEVVLAAIGGVKQVKSARGLVVVADVTAQDLRAAGRWNATSWDAVIVPGGMPGASNLAASALCSSLIKEMFAAGHLVAAICAAPAAVLAPLGILAGRRFTCYPGMEKTVSFATWSADRVVVDGNVVTSRAAGTAGDWSRELVERLFGHVAAEKLAESVLL